MRKPTVGETLYSLNIGNAARNREQVLTPVQVKKVGRKYFWCGDNNNEYMWKKYHIDGWEQENRGYIADSFLYESHEQYANEQEEANICKRIYEAFSYGKNVKKLTIEELRYIDKMISR